MARYSAAQARNLLEHLANLPDEPERFEEEAESLARRFPQLFGEIHRVFVNDLKSNRDDYLRAVMGLREHVRRAWQAQDPHKGRWIVFQMRRLYVRLYEKAIADAIKPPAERMLEGYPLLQLLYEAGRQGYQQLRFWGLAVEPLPPFTPFEEIMLHFERMLDRTRVCANPDCPHPYFFAHRKRYKHCSDKCSVIAQSEYKRRWWAEKGKQRRDQKKHRGSQV